MPTYKEIVEKFKAAGCVLMTSNNEYNVMKDKFKSIFMFRTLCGHVNKVTLINFWYKGTGTICKNCLINNQRILQATEKKDTNKQEYVGLKKIAETIQDDFYIEKTNEGCLADMLIKPKYVTDDKWLMIQIKTTMDVCHNLYSFKTKNINYHNCIIICFCINLEKLWVLDHTQLVGKTQINIGLTDKSELYPYELNMSSLCDRLHIDYAKERKYRKGYCMIPKSVFQQQEHFYRNLREENIHYLDYLYPDIDGRVFDFIVNGLKVQEKVASIAKQTKDNTYYVISLGRSKVKEAKHYHRNYYVGDNDVYWFWLKGDTNQFCIIPEIELIKRKYIINEDDEHTITAFSFSDNDWTNKYKYTLDDDQLEKKLKSIFKL